MFYNYILINLTKNEKNRFFTTYNNVIIEGKTRLILKGDQALLGHIFNDNNTNVLRTYYLLEELNGHFKVTKDFKGIEIKAHYINNLLDLIILSLKTTSICFL